MPTEVKDYSNVREKLDDLGCESPSGFAILPVNFESEDSIDRFRQVSEAATVKTLLRSKDLPYDEVFDSKDKPPYIQNNAFEWIAPTLFVSAALLSQNPYYITIALNIISDYATDFLKGIEGESSVSMDIIVETTDEKEYKKISCEGSPEGLKELGSLIEEVNQNKE